MLVQENSQLRSMLNTLCASPGGDWDNATLHLFQNDIVPSFATALGDFTEADFDGYAAGAAITWNPAVTGPDYNAEVTGPAANFLATGATTPNVIYGYYVVDTGGTGLLWSERFAEPINIASAGDGFSVVPRFVLAHGLPGL